VNGPSLPTVCHSSGVAASCKLFRCKEFHCGSFCLQEISLLGSEFILRIWNHWLLRAVDSQLSLLVYCIRLCHLDSFASDCLPVIGCFRRHSGSTESQSHVAFYSSNCLPLAPLGWCRELWICVLSISIFQNVSIRPSIIKFEFEFGFGCPRLCGQGHVPEIS